MNSDSIRVIRSDYASTHPFAPAALSLASTTDTTIKFANTTGPAIVSVPLGTEIFGSFTPTDPNQNAAVLGGSMGRPGPGGRSQAPYFNSGSFDGRPFTVSASFKFTVVSAAGGASVWTPKLWLGTNSTPGSNSAILAATGISVPASHTANGSATIQATLIWDSVSQCVNGEAWAIVQAFDTTASGAITSVYTSRTNMTTITAQALSNLSFLTSIVIATTAPTSSSTTLTELAISQI